MTAQELGRILIGKGRLGGQVEGNVVMAGQEVLEERTLPGLTRPGQDNGGARRDGALDFGMKAAMDPRASTLRQERL